MKPLYFYGSLRDRGLLELVLARRVDEADMLPARAQGFAAVCMDGEPYPALLPADGGAADGVVVRNLSDADLDRLCYFEEAEYGLAPIATHTAEGALEALYFQTTGKLGNTGTPWDYDRWLAEDRLAAHAAAEELMAHFGVVPVERIDDIWPGITIRSRMRGRARAAVPVTGGLRSAFGPEDVEQIAVERPYTRFFAIEEQVLRHRRHDGSMTPEIRRTVLVAGDAVTVLPYDPVRDSVLLIEQFRAPHHARGDGCPWGLEAVAGRLDKSSDPETVARQEALEEAGLELGRLERIGGYYPSSGVLAEYIDAYVAEADLEEAGGRFGLAEEAEDIRAFAVPFDRAMQACTEGEIENGPLMLSLFWLAANRERLRENWCARP